MTPHLQLSLFGTPTVRREGHLVTDFVSSKAQALLFYLALTQRAHTRSTLASLLWEDVPETNARTSLRGVLANLKQLVGSHLEIERQTLAFKPAAPHSLDVAEFERHLIDTTGHVGVEPLQAAIELYEGDLLEGFYIYDALNFEKWLQSERKRLREMALGALKQLAQNSVAQNKMMLAIDYTRQTLALEPWREESHRQLMEYYARIGERSAALAQYEVCRLTLEDELAVGPSEATKALYNQIRYGAQPTSDEQALRPVDKTPEDLSQSLPTESSDRQHNLPFLTTPLVGRQYELASIKRLLRQNDVRLVTLTGPGGIGKTRLALQTAIDLSTAKDYAISTQICYVPLSSIRDSDLVMSQIAQMLGVHLEGSQAPLETVASYIGDKSVLLLLDNFEHVISSTPEISALLASCPLLNIFVTSRQTLHVMGEHEYPVPPLPVPELTDASVVETLLQNESIQLFTQRARAVMPEFMVTAENAATVAEILFRLEGLPLSIELAAARLKVLGPMTLLERLEHRFEVLRAGARDAPDRHQTLRRAMAWSYDLLDKTEQTLFRCLTVFVGSCTLEAVRSIYAGIDGQGTGGDGSDAGHYALPATQTPNRMDMILEGMSSLLDKCLIQRKSDAEGHLRFILLETIREYGLEKLLERGEEQLVRRAHAQYYLALAEALEPLLMGSEQQATLKQFEIEHSNFLDALHWSIAGNEVEIGPSLGIALWHFWYIRGHQKKGRELLESLLTFTTDLKNRANLHYGLGMLARREGDTAAAFTNFEFSVAIYQELDDELGVASSLRTLGFMEYLRGDYPTARIHLQNSLRKFRALGNDEGAAATLTNLGYVAQSEHKFSRAMSFMKMSLELRRASNNRHGIATTLASMGYTATRQGDYTLAREYLTECLHINQELSNFHEISVVLTGLGDIAFAENNYSGAHAYFKEALILSQEAGDNTQVAGAHMKVATTSLKKNDTETAILHLKQALTLGRESLNTRGIITALEYFASVLVIRKRYRVALKVAAAADKAREPLGKTRLLANQQAFEDTLRIAKAALFGTEADLAWRAGETLPLGQAVDYALQEMGQRTID